MEPRRAGEHELEALVALDRRCFAHAWGEAAWLPELRGGTVFCLEEEGALVAAACAPIIVDTCELRRIAVDPRARRRGIGRDLLTFVIEHAGALGCTLVQLEVAASNAPALGLYAAFGFERVGNRPHYYEDPPDDALLLDLRLPTSKQENVD